MTNWRIACAHYRQADVQPQNDVFDPRRRFVPVPAAFLKAGDCLPDTCGSTSSGLIPDLVRVPAGQGYVTVEARRQDRCRRAGLPLVGIPLVEEDYSSTCYDTAIPWLGYRTKVLFIQ